MYIKEQLHRERIAGSFAKRLENACYGPEVALTAECQVFQPPRPLAARGDSGDENGRRLGNPSSLSALVAVIVDRRFVSTTECTYD